jgi:hypothetical protein
MPEREKHDREQMNMIYNTIVSKGLAKEDQIVFVRGRGTELNSSTMASCTASGFKMYCPSTKPATMQLGGGGGGGGTYGLQPQQVSGLQPQQVSGLQPQRVSGLQPQRNVLGLLPATTTVAATVNRPSNTDNGMR